MSILDHGANYPLRKQSLRLGSSVTEVGVREFSTNRRTVHHQHMVATSTNEDMF